MAWGPAGRICYHPHDMFDTQSTIVALSSPAGVGGRAIVRLSGPRALALAEGVFRAEGSRLEELGGFRAVDGAVRCEGLALPGRAYVFRGPRSYTRDDVVELHIPGNPLAAGMLIESLLAGGARAAGPGEFTFRAFVSGRIDLSQAEAVADVIAAATDTQLRAASANAAGALHSLCRRWSDALAEALAQVEASIDLAEEEIELVAPAALAEQLIDLAEQMRRMAGDAITVTTAADIPRVALAGAPNVGKSSLLNALTGLDRAIVSATAGTTRDVLTAPLTLPGGQEILLIDLAGLTCPDGVIARAADIAARAALAGADAVLAVVDAAAGLDLEIVEEIRSARASGARTASLTLLANKIDRLSPPAAQARLAELIERSHLPVLATSAVTGAGLSAVRERLAAVLGVEANRIGSGCALHQRQRRSVLQAAEALAEAARRLRPLDHVSDAAEIVAVDLRTALAELGTISGQMATDELLGRIFARFCVGK